MFDTNDLIDDGEDYYFFCVYAAAAAVVCVCVCVCVCWLNNHYYDSIRNLFYLENHHTTQTHNKKNSTHNTHTFSHRDRVRRIKGLIAGRISQYTSQEETEAALLVLSAESRLPMVLGLFTTAVENTFLHTRHAKLYEGVLKSTF